MVRDKTRVVLVGSEIEENLALRYLAASLAEHGHQVAIAPCSAEVDFGGVLDLVRRNRPALVGISMAFQSRAAMYLRMAELIRSQGYIGHLVVGGHFPTFEFETILKTQPAIDSVGRFEGEATMVALADSLSNGGDLSSVPNLVFRAGDGLCENPCIHEFPNLDLLPFPVRAPRMQERLGERFATLVSSRGCWHSSCLYCCIGAFHRFKRTKFALRRPESVAREIAQLVERHGVRIIQFHDDNFTLATKEMTLARLESLSKALRQAGVDTDSLALLIKARPDSIDDEVGDALRDVGCTGVFLGIENACPTGLLSLIRGTSMEGVEQALAALHTRGIAATYNLLLFHPKAQLQEFLDNIRFIEGHMDVTFDLGRAEIVAGSPLDKLVRALNLRRGQWPHWDYVMLDTAMNRLLDVFCYAFRHPQSSESQAAQCVIGLAYQAAAVLKFYPGQATRSFAHEVDTVVRSWNTSVAQALRKAALIVSEARPAMEMEDIRLEVDQAATEVLGRAARLQAPMINYQRVRKIFDRFGVGDALDSQRMLRRLLNC